MTPSRGDHVVLNMRGRPRAVVLAVDDDVMRVQLVHGGDLLTLPTDAVVSSDPARPQLHLPAAVAYVED